MPVSRPTIVSFREIDASTVRAITDLCVAPGQERYVASNAVSIAQAHFEPHAWFRAIYADESPAGFVLLRDPTLGGRPPREAAFSLWRFMVDARFQHAGVGRQALSLLIAHARTRPGVTAVHTSCVAGPNSPVGFYRTFGFEETGEVKANGEIGLVFELPLRPSHRPHPA